MERDNELLTRLEQQNQIARRRTLLGFLVDGLSRLLGIDVASVDASARFVDLSADSLKAVELKQWLERSLGLRLRSTLLFDYATPNELCDHLLDRLGQRPSTAATPQPASMLALEGGANEPSDDDVAVVGYACRLPGGCVDPNGFWGLLHEGRDAIVALDRNVLGPRSTLEHAAPDFPAFAGLIGDVAGFDARLFGVSPKEAVEMDPQQRVLLEVCWQALENAGVPIRGEAGRDVGVFVGTRGSEYHDARRLVGEAGFQGTGASVAALSGRVAHCFGFTGPAVTIDTACSASLVALHYAAEDLRRGSASLALVAGVNLLLAPFAMRATHGARMLAPDGRCKAFSARANGYVRSEGCVVLVLQRAQEAIAAGREILGIIKGSAVNQDGTTSGLTVPSARAQREVIQLALRRAKVSAHAIDYVECHGTGTELGDPIELQALSEALATGEREAPLPIGSVKSQIGHTEPTAGLASVLKVLLAMRHGVMPRTLHCEAGLNGHVSWPELGLAPVLANRSWAPRAGGRVAGVSSFGFTGTNAHVVIAGAPPAARPEAHGGPVLLTLAAATPSALEESCLAWAAWLAARSAEEVEAACRASLVTRSTLPFRRGVVAADAQSLRAALEQPVTPAVRRAGAPAVKLVLAAGVDELAAFDGELVAHWPAFDSALSQAKADVARASGVASADWSAGAHRDLQALSVGLALGAALQRLGCEIVAYAGEGIGLVAAHVLAGANLDSALLRWMAGGKLEGLSNGGVAGLEGLGSSAPEEGCVVVVVGNVPVSDEALPLSPTLASLLALVARLFELNAKLELGSLLRPRASRYLDLPSYPFERRPFWASEASAAVATSDAPLCRELRSPLLPPGTRAFVVELGTERCPWLGEHRVEGLPIYPAAGVLDALRSVGALVWNDAQVVIGDLALERAMLLGPTQFTLHVTLVASGESELAVELSSESAPGAFVRHATARLSRRPEAAAAEADARARGEVGALKRAGQEVYELLRAAGIEHGPRFRALQVVRHDAVSALAEVVVPTLPAAAWGAVGLDACFLASVPLLREIGDLAARLPSGCDEACFFRPLPAAFEARVQLRGAANAPEIKVDLDLFEGEVRLARIRGLRLASRARSTSAVVAPTLRVDWVERALPLGTAADAPGSFEIVTDDASFGARLVAVLRAVHGASATFRAPGEAGQLSEQPRHVVWVNRASSGADFLRAIHGELSRLSGLPRGCRLWCVARVAHASARDRESFATVSRHALAGLVRTMQHEAPRLSPVLIELTDDQSAELECELLAAEFRRNDRDPELRYADGRRLARRLIPDASSSAPLRAEPLARDGSYLVTGGAGGLGQLIVERLSEAGAGHVIVASRAPSGLEALRARLAARGTRLSVWTLDVADRAGLASKLADVDAEREPLRGIVHTAGVVRDHVLEHIELSELEQVLAPKLFGAWNLHELTLATPLDFFVVFSSLAGILGSPGQGSYAAANTFQDALIAARNAAGLPGVSLAFGPWGEAGMAAREGSEGAQRLARLGVNALSNRLGLAAFDAALARGQGVAVVADIDWSTYARSVDPRLSDVVPSNDTDGAAGSAGEVGAELRELIASDSGRARGKVDEYLQARLADVCGGRALSEHDSFFELGLDSLQAVSLRNRIERDLGIELSASVIFDYPTLADLRRHLLRDHFGAPAAEAPPIAPVADTTFQSWNTHWEGGADGQLAEGEMAAFMASLQSLEQELES